MTYAVATPISVYIDNNVWDFLFERRLDLCIELPREQFWPAITREAEFEIPGMPENLKAFVLNTIARREVPTDILFGFYDETLAADQQRFGGFDQGRWENDDELAYSIQQEKTSIQSKRPTGLFKDEADRSIALRSSHSVVLTHDTKKNGPIKKALSDGHKVISLNEFDASGLTLAEFIHENLAQRDGVDHNDEPK
jgi:hypothetical protein